MKILDKFTDTELREIRRIAESGQLIEVINNKITNMKKCPICTSDVEEGKLTLHFEENNIRKKASFCGSDCLQYFLNNMTKIYK